MRLIDEWTFAANDVRPPALCKWSRAGFSADLEARTEGLMMLAKFVLRAVFAALGLWAASRFVPGIRFDSPTTLAFAAVLLGVVNAFVRPVVFILTLPITIITLGLFLLVVNAMMIGLVAVALRGFHVDGLIPGMLTAIVTGIASWIGGLALRDDRR
jgi:putative membrane protein